MPRGGLGERQLANVGKCGCIIDTCNGLLLHLVCVSCSSDSKV